MWSLALDTTALLREGESPPPRRAAGWPLMGDITGHRGGVPEHLIQWRRAEGEHDPAPQLKP